MGKKADGKVLAQNKKASHDYFIEDTDEADASPLLATHARTTPVESKNGPSLKRALRIKRIFQAREIQSTVS